MYSYGCLHQSMYVGRYVGILASLTTFVTFAHVGRGSRLGRRREDGRKEEGLLSSALLSRQRRGTANKWAEEAQQNNVA